MQFSVDDQTKIASNSLGIDQEIYKKERIGQDKINNIIASGYILSLKKDFKNAIVEYDKALQISPENSRALEYKGYALYRVGEYENAINILKKANSIESNSVNILMNLLKSYCASGEHALASEIVEKNKEFLIKKTNDLRSDIELKRVCSNIAIPGL